MKGYRRIISFLLLIALLAAGCGGVRSEGQPSTGSPATAPPEAAATAVLLYFTDGQEWALHPEERRVSATGDSLPEAVVQALLDGPAEQSLLPILPPGVELRSVHVADGVAQVDLSAEVRTNHWGGSTTEKMTIYGLVYTLTGLPGIDRVQLLVEGELAEDLAGHFKIDQPLEPKLRTGRAPVDRRWARAMQERLLAGEERWRTEPVSVARFEGQGFGFRPSDRFELTSQGAGQAEVLVTHEGAQFRIELEQPVQQGADGVWVIVALEPVD